MSKIVKYISILIIVTIAVSCGKQLQLDPIDSIVQEKVFASVTDLEQGLLGVYRQASPVNKVYIASLLSDELKISSENLGQGQATYKFQYSSGDGDHNAGFNAGYVTLDFLHRVLSQIDRVPSKDNAEDVKKKTIRAELLGLRGITYYELLIQFMPSGYDPNALGVPIILESNILAAIPRSSVGAVIAQIESDLAAARAEPSIPDAPDATKEDLRLCKAAIAAYQARVALLKRDWPGAITYATNAITLSGKSLATAGDFQAYWGEANDIETIWQYKNNISPQGLYRTAAGITYFEPSGKLKGLFDRSNDVRFNAFFGSNGGDTSIVVKYPGSSLGPQFNSIKVLRVAEMYLTRAEAYAESNQLALAATDLNGLRSTRINGYTDVAFTTSAEAVTAVLNERFKEFCFEGFRFFDLKRKGLAVDRLLSDVESTVWQTLPANNFRFALPIPNTEMLANPKQVQNPGY